MKPPRWWTARQARLALAAEAEIAAQLAKKPGQAGWPLMKQTGLSGPRLYAALERMEKAGTVVAEWEPGPVPRRRMWSLTDQRAEASRG